MCIEEKLKNIENQVKVLESDIFSLPLPQLYKDYIKKSLDSLQSNIQRYTKVLLPQEEKKEPNKKVKIFKKISSASNQNEKKPTLPQKFIKCEICNVNVLEKNLEKHNKKKHKLFAMPKAKNNHTKEDIREVV